VSGNVMYAGRHAMSGEVMMHAVRQGVSRASSGAAIRAMNRRARGPKFRAGWIGPACAMAVLLLVGCGDAPPPDPVLARLQAIADAPAIEVVTSLMSAYGGYDTWRKRRNVEYVCRLEFYKAGKGPQASTRQLHRFALGVPPRAYVEDLDSPVPQIVRLDGEAFEVTRGGVPVIDPALLEFPRAWVTIARRSFLVPWSLLDAGATIEARSPRTPPPSGPVPPGMCDVIRLRRDDANDGLAPDDWQDIYVSRLTRLVERIHQYRSGDHSFRVAIWSDHRTFDGLRVATIRRMYTSDATGAVGALEVVSEYSDVRFDAPFGDEVFRPTAPPLAASTGGE